MAISRKSIKILWAAAGGRCAFPDCWERLSYHEAEEAAPHTIGEMAHICGERPGANRHDHTQTPEERDNYQNLILLCPTHHTIIDRPENEERYTVEILHTMKSTHESRILERLEMEPLPTKIDVARTILPLLEQNKQTWTQYGPHSEIARTQPHNESAHAVWKSERLSVIVPNNRKIKAQVEEHSAVFNPDEQAVITAFIVHARSYEQWVQDAIPYAAVRRFPKEFDALVRGLVDGR